MAKEHCEVAKESSLIGLTDSSKVTQKPAAVSHRGWGRAVQISVESSLPAASQECLFYRRLGGDAKVGPHEVKKNAMDTKLPQQVRVTVE